MAPVLFIEELSSQSQDLRSKIIRMCRFRSAAERSEKRVPALSIAAVSAR